ncbi:hypothetical protein H5410_003218 [Solanum commersonii]|uniref:Uncharacterized protein n=1 Tax=Solanum commersonii TaxID=4109 RepID=A0A9J6B428_SOLCO|nr:hypothetical protein H5410_003218 [Solanum commersonii]
MVWTCEETVSEAAQMVRRCEDASVIFYEANAKQLSFMRMILVIFEATSSLCVNWRKNSIFPIKVVSHMQSLASILGCRIDQFPIVYLGMPIGNQQKELEICDLNSRKNGKEAIKVENSIPFSRRKNYSDKFNFRSTTNLCNVIIPHSLQGGEDLSRHWWSWYEEFEGAKRLLADEVALQIFQGGSCIVEGMLRTIGNIWSNLAMSLHYEVGNDTKILLSGHETLMNSYPDLISF